MIDGSSTNTKMQYVFNFFVDLEDVNGTRWSRNEDDSKSIYEADSCWKILIKGELINNFELLIIK
jgi:hypothetical protein